MRDEFLCSRGWRGGSHFLPTTSCPRISRRADSRDEDHATGASPLLSGIRKISLRCNRQNLTRCGRLRGRVPAGLAVEKSDLLPSRWAEATRPGGLVRRYQIAECPRQPCGAFDFAAGLVLPTIYQRTKSAAESVFRPVSRMTNSVRASRSISP